MEANLSEAKVINGKSLAQWFKSNSWPQGIAEVWAKANGSPGPWASQINPLFKGTATPEPQFFVSLANFNAAISSGELGPIEHLKYREKLQAGEPFCTDEGKPFDVMDFFALFIGLIEPPTKYKPAVGPSQEIVDKHWHAQKAAYSKNLKQSKLSERKFLADWINQFEKAGFPEGLVDLVFEVLTSDKTPTAEEMAPFMHPDGQLKVEI